MDSAVLKQHLDLSFLKTVREGIEDGEDDEGEGKFGLVPFSKDPNSVLAHSNTHVQKNRGERLKPHPLLSKSAQFSGIDKSLTGDPMSNEEAQEKYPQLRLQLRHQYGQRKGKAPPRLAR